MSTAVVALAACPDYEPATVREGLKALLAGLGGMRRFVSRGDRVLLKPNLLAARAVERQVCTHPAIIRAVAEAAIEAGAAEVWVGDSPGFGSCAGALNKLGFLPVAQELGLRVAPFDRPVAHHNAGGRRFRRFEIERQLLEMDRIINLAKVKTHMQMFMTLAVKNTFGYVVGTRKAAWHLEAGRDEELFARMLLDLHYGLPPALNIADGIIMMEGNGPGSGTPRAWGALAASADAVALDTALCRLLAVPASHLPTLRVARKEGYGIFAEEAISFVGCRPEELALPAIVHPRLSFVGDFITPRPLLRLTRRLIEVRPAVLPRRCSGCGLCRQQCPAQAIAMVAARNPNGQVARIHPNLCIHCYCCQELCPEGAIEARRGLVRSLLRRPEGHNG